MLKKLRRALAELEGQKFKHFDEFERILKRIQREYGYLFPKFSENRKGSSYVYNFGIPEVQPVSLEREHGSREFIPHKFAKRAIQGIEDVLDFIEVNVPDEENDSEKDESNDNPVAREEAPGILPPPKIPNGDR